MRIALLAQDFPPRRGGTQAYNVEFATRLAERGHDVFVTRKGAVRAREGDLVEIVYTLRQVVCVKG